MEKAVLSPELPSIARTTRVLIADDEPMVRMVLKRWLEREGYHCSTAVDGNEAWALLREQPFDIMISDIVMPGMSGIDLLAKALVHDPNLAVIMVTALTDRHTAGIALQLGAYGYIIKPFDENEVLIDVANARERRRLALVSQEYERELEAKVAARTLEIQRREEEITLHLVAASEYRDEDTGRHIRRIGLYAAALGRALGWSSEAIETLRLAAPMHDIGKIGIPDHILLKQGKLTTQEFEIMKRHTAIGAAILDRSEIHLLRMGRKIAMQHHERWDGSGYPNQMPGEMIDEGARIVSLADVFDALVTDRIYRPAFSEAQALATIEQGSGSHFEPRLYECFMDIYPTIREIRYEICPDGGSDDVMLQADSVS